MNKNKLISICADDFGITDKVDKTIVDLLKKKRITETSCMVLSENFKNSSKELKKIPFEFGSGIHLTLTDFHSLTSPKSISKDGKLLSFKDLFIKIYKKEVLAEEISKEINAQLDSFENLMDSKPDFIDGHHHIHQLSLIRDLIFDILKKRYKNSLPWVRNTYEDKFIILKRNISLFKTFLISYYGYKLKKKAILNNFKTNNGFSGIYDFKQNSNYKKLFVNFIKSINDKHLLMVHPGESDENLQKIDSVTSTRNLERDFLKSDDFLNILEENSVELRPLHTIIS